MSVRICDEMLYVSFALFIGNSKAFRNERMNIDRVRERESKRLKRNMENT